MELIYLLLGIGILLLVTVDVFWTTLWVEGGAGPVANRLTTFLWKFSRKVTGDSSRVLSLSGPFILVFTLLTWLFMLWLGWTLFFAGDSQAIIDTRDDLPIDWVERAYVAGYLVFTLGIGDYVPKEGFWQVATAFASGFGLLFLTLSVTYVLSVLSAVTQQRAFASSITGMGKSGSEFVKNAWDGRNFHDVDLVLNSISSQLSTVTAQNKAYPIVHYYHSASSDRATSYAVAILDDALTIMNYGIPEKYQPNELLVQETRSTVANYLDALSPNYITASDHLPPTPDLLSLRREGIPVVDSQVFDSKLKKSEQRRRRLLGVVESDARKWPTA